MDKSHRERRERMIFRFSFISTAFSLFVVLVLTFAQAYVRWAANQNFTFLGGNELEALTVSVFASIIAMSYIYRPNRNPIRESEVV